MRIVLVGFCLCWPLLLLVPNQAQQKPTLYVVESEGCPPCRDFARCWTNTPGFADRLRLGFEVRGLHWENAEQRAFAQTLGVTRMPAFVVVSPTGQHRGMIVGFTSENDLLADLRLPPLLRSISRSKEVLEPDTQPEAMPTPAPPRKDPDPPRPQVDNTARREIQRLESAIEAMREKLKGVGQTPDSSAEVRGIREEIEKLKAAAAAEAMKLGKDVISQTPGGLIPLPEPAAASGLTAIALKAVATFLLPEVAIPAGALSVAATVGGWWLGRRRRKSRPQLQDQAAASSGSDQGSVTVLRDSTTRQNTANHYVVKETDRVGEAYKEALRRTVAAYKSDKPGIVDVAGQIEHVAQELLRGQNVETRANTTRPGIWTDSQESN